MATALAVAGEAAACPSPSVQQHAQESTLRALLTSGACPRFAQAVAALHGADADSDAAQQLTCEQLLTALRSVPCTTYDDMAEPIQQLMAAMREGDQARADALAANLCGKPPTDWGMTSGTTGASKFFPLTAMSMQRASMACGGPFVRLFLRKFPCQAGSGSSSSSGFTPPSRHRVLSLALAGPCEEMPGGALVGSISAIYLLKLSRAGVSMDMDGAHDMSCKPAALPCLMASQPNVSAAARYYSLWLCAAANPGFTGITMLTDFFAGNMLTAVSLLREFWRDIVADLTAGRMVSSYGQELPPAAMESIDGWLAAAGPQALAASAAHIQQVMAAQHEAAAAGKAPLPLLGELLPHLLVVNVVITGTHGKFCHELQALLRPGTAVLTSVYAGTEGIYGVTEQLVRPGPFDPTPSPADQCYVLLPSSNCFFEFREAVTHQQHDEGQGTGLLLYEQPPEQQQQRPMLDIDHLQAGRDYEVWITTFCGLCRYEVGDVVRVEDYVLFDTESCLILPDAAAAAAGGGGAAGSQQQAQQPSEQGARIARLPLISFQGRVGVALNIICEKMDESQLLRAVRSTDAQLRSRDQPGSSSSFSGLAEFCATEALSEAGGNKHYRFFWELLPQPQHAPSGGSASPPPPPAADLAHWAAVLDANLAAQNVLYRNQVAAGQMGPAAIQLVAPGTFRKLKDRLVVSKRISPSQYKQPTVVPPDSVTAKFLSEHVLP